MSLSPYLTAAYVKSRCPCGESGDIAGAKLIMLEMTRRTNIAEAAEGAVAQVC